MTEPPPPAGPNAAALQLLGTEIDAARNAVGRAGITLWAVKIALAGVLWLLISTAATSSVPWRASWTWAVALWIAYDNGVRIANLASAAEPDSLGLRFVRIRALTSDGILGAWFVVDVALFTASVWLGRVYWPTRGNPAAVYLVFDALPLAAGWMFLHVHVVESLPFPTSFGHAAAGGKVAIRALLISIFVLALAALWQFFPHDLTALRSSWVVDAGAARVGVAIAAGAYLIIELARQRALITPLTGLELLRRELLLHRISADEAVRLCMELSGTLQPKDLLRAETNVIVSAAVELESIAVNGAEAPTLEHALRIQRRAKTAYARASLTLQFLSFLAKPAAEALQFRYAQLTNHIGLIEGNVQRIQTPLPPSYDPVV